ncbi:thiamine phosphate synthase [bacterium]|nr:thiamine phosphate synthase [bacterium]
MEIEKMADLDKKEKETLFRIFDANSNRCAEGLRVVEEIARLGMNDAALAGEIKLLRHAVRFNAGSLMDNSIKYRDSDGDVGKNLPSETEMSRSSFGSVLRASFLRAEEGLRVLEEFSKLICVEASLKFKRLRFRVYNLEKIFLSEEEQNAVIPASPFLYAIVDRSFVIASRVKEVTNALCAGGADIIQYRAKNVTVEESLADLSIILFEASKRNVPVVVNDDPFLAAQSGADGVHIGSSDPDPSVAREILGPDAIIGLTIDSLAKLDDKALELVNYVGVGPVFPSSTKSELAAIGPGFVREARRKTDLSIVAIGGITPMNAESVFEHGADGIAVISSLLQGDIAKNCFTFRQIIDKR